MTTTMEAQVFSESVKASIHFLEASPLFDTIKPYTFRHSGEGLEIPRNNIRHNLEEGILVSDLRGREHEFTLEEAGFEIIYHESVLAYEEFDRPQSLSVYFAELESILKKRFNAKHVKAFRHNIRKRHPQFPISIGANYDYDQPTTVAHVDTTPEELKEEIRRQFSPEVDTVFRHRVQWINVWKPLRGPVNDYPLALCDTRTVNAARDFEAMDLLYPDLETENYQIYYRESYKWYYLRDHQPYELLVFLQADTADMSNIGVPHTAFDNPLSSAHEAPRESIEVRLLLIF